MICGICDTVHEMQKYNKNNTHENIQSERHSHPTNKPFCNHFEQNSTDVMEENERKEFRWR